MKIASTKLEQASTLAVFVGAPHEKRVRHKEMKIASANLEQASILAIFRRAVHDGLSPQRNESLYQSGTSLDFGCFQERGSDFARALSAAAGSFQHRAV